MTTPGMSRHSREHQKWSSFSLTQKREIENPFIHMFDIYSLLANPRQHALNTNLYDMVVSTTTVHLIRKVIGGYFNCNESHLDLKLWNHPARPLQKRSPVDLHGSTFSSRIRRHERGDSHDDRGLWGWAFWQQLYSPASLVHRQSLAGSPARPPLSRPRRQDQPIPAKGGNCENTKATHSCSCCSRAPLDVTSASSLFQR